MRERMEIKGSDEMRGDERKGEERAKRKERN